MISDEALSRAADLADCLPETPENYLMLRQLRRILSGQEQTHLCLALKNTTQKVAPS